MSSTRQRAARTSLSDPPLSFTRIAVGVDGLAEGEDAVALGAMLAELTGAAVVLTAVHPDPLVVMPETMNWTALESEARALLHRTRDAAVPDARVVVETGFSVPYTLERVVARDRCDLLVVGSSRHAPEGQVRIGKRTRQLLGHARCVLAIAPHGWRRDVHRPHRIAVGFDGGAEAHAALRAAAELARVAGSDLLVQAVVDDRVPPIGWSQIAHGGAAHPRWEDAVLDTSRALEQSAAAAATAAGATPSVSVARGRPADALLSLSHDVDLLVIGSRRWGAAARVLLGSTGEALTHGAACPLLIVPRGPEEHRDR